MYFDRAVRFPIEIKNIRRRRPFPPKKNQPTTFPTRFISIYFIILLSCIAAVARVGGIQMRYNDGEFYDVNPIKKCLRLIIVH